jgi:hypothetical protein
VRSSDETSKEMSKLSDRDLAQPDKYLGDHAQRIHVAPDVRVVIDQLVAQASVEQGLDDPK